jgi:hypothetical protein
MKHNQDELGESPLFLLLTWEFNDGTLRLDKNLIYYFTRSAVG